MSQDPGANSPKTREPMVDFALARLEITDSGSLVLSLRSVASISDALDALPRTPAALVDPVQGLLALAAVLRDNQQSPLAADGIEASIGLSDNASWFLFESSETEETRDELERKFTQPAFARVLSHRAPSIREPAPPGSVRLGSLMPSQSRPSLPRRRFSRNSDTVPSE